MRRFYIQQSAITFPTSIISGAEARHIQKVLRLKPGDKIGLLDGSGRDYEAIINSVHLNRVEVSIIRSFPAAKVEPPVQIIVAQAFLKDKKMDLIVRQLTEIGMSVWIPFFTERSVPRPDNQRLLSRTKRWNKIIMESVKQCGRGNILKTVAATTFEKMLHLGEGADLKIAFWEKESRSVNSIPALPGRHFNKIFAMFGPEGGFSCREIEKAKACGFITSTLGPRILRAETATIAACTILQYLFGDMGYKKILDKPGSF